MQGSYSISGGFGQQFFLRRHMARQGGVFQPPVAGYLPQHPKPPGTVKLWSSR